MFEHPLLWLFWSGAAVIGYSYIAASIKYFLHLRQGSRIMAAQALVQAALSTFGLFALWAIHHRYLTG